MVMIAVIKEEMRKCLKVIQGNAKEEWKEMNQTPQKPQSGNRINKEKNKVKLIWKWKI